MNNTLPTDGRQAADYGATDREGPGDGESSGDLAHEINSPLQTLLSNTGFLSDRIDLLFQLVDHYQESLDPNTPNLSREDRFANASQLFNARQFIQLKVEIREAVKETCEGISRIACVVANC